MICLCASIPADSTDSAANGNYTTAGFRLKHFLVFSCRFWLLSLHWRALDYIGRLLTWLDLGNVYDRLLDWIETHPKLAHDFGPGVLIAAGIVSLCLIHWRWLYNMWEKFVAKSNRVHTVPPATPTQPVLYPFFSFKRRFRAKQDEFLW
jgi:hypothetical protein